MSALALRPIPWEKAWVLYVGNQEVDQREKPGDEIDPEYP
jgi:hypothetical protein